MPDGFKYNVDLLLEAADRDAFLQRFPQFAFAFDDPELRTLFEAIDSKATKAKRASRTVGGAALGVVVAALLVGAFAGTFPEAPWFRIAVTTAAVVGVIGLIAGWAGVMMANARDEWLRQRFVCERLRQLHFQTLVGWAPQIIDAAKTGDTTAFFSARRARTQKFTSQVVNASAVVLADLLADRSGDATWLVEVDKRPAPDDPLSVAYFEALRERRLQHQHDFTGYQLLSYWTLRPKSPLQTARLLSSVGAFCALLLLCLGVAGLAIEAVTGRLASITYSVMIGLAIIALAARTLEEGLQAHGEVGRYRTYDAGLRRLVQRYRDAQGNDERRGILIELEEYSFDEMVGLLKLHRDARFLM